MLYFFCNFIKFCIYLGICVFLFYNIVVFVNVLNRLFGYFGLIILVLVNYDRYFCGDIKNYVFELIVNDVKFGYWLYLV